MIFTNRLSHGSHTLIMSLLVFFVLWHFWPVRSCSCRSKVYMSEWRFIYFANRAFSLLQHVSAVWCSEHCVAHKINRCDSYTDTVTLLFLFNCFCLVLFFLSWNHFKSMFGGLLFGLFVFFCASRHFFPWIPLLSDCCETLFYNYRHLVQCFFGWSPNSNKCYPNVKIGCPPLRQIHRDTWGLNFCLSQLFALTNLWRFMFGNSGREKGLEC